jgi:hypothetical protein
MLELVAMRAFLVVFLEVQKSAVMPVLELMPVPELELVAMPKPKLLLRVKQLEVQRLVLQGVLKLVVASTSPQVLQLVVALKEKLVEAAKLKLPLVAVPQRVLLQ